MRCVRSRRDRYRAAVLIASSLAVIGLVSYSIWFQISGNSASDVETGMYEQDTQITADESPDASGTGSAPQSDDGTEEISVSDDGILSEDISDDDSASEESSDGSFGRTEKSPKSSGALVSSIEGGIITRKSSSLDVQEAASELLIEYRDRCDCVLYRSGYLDMQGHVWSCVIVGDRWVDMCFVEATEDAKGSELMVVRMDVNAWEHELQQELGG